MNESHNLVKLNISLALLESFTLLADDPNVNTLGFGSSVQLEFCQYLKDPFQASRKECCQTGMVVGLGVAPEHELNGFYLGKIKKVSSANENRRTVTKWEKYRLFAGFARESMHYILSKVLA